VGAFQKMVTQPVTGVGRRGPRHPTVLRSVWDGDMKKIILLAIFGMLTSIASADEQIPEWQSEFVSSSLKSAIIHIHSEQLGVDSNPKSQSFVGLMHALAIIDTPESLKALVELSDYYLGSAPSQDLGALITGKGLKIKPILVSKKKTSISCNIKGRCLSAEERNRKIDYWITLIDKSKQIELIR
jgi:hypothetical protein